MGIVGAARATKESHHSQQLYYSLYIYTHTLVFTSYTTYFFLSKIIVIIFDFILRVVLLFSTPAQQHLIYVVMLLFKNVKLVSTQLSE